jgi:mono/diheme cytochrome c family protein
MKVRRFIFQIAEWRIAKSPRQLLALLLIAGCPTLTLAQEPSKPPKPVRSIYAPLEKAPASVRARSNPFAANPEEAKAGQKLFEQHCSECHGDSGAGTRRGPSLLVKPVQRATPGALFWVLTNGVVWRGMPVWSKLPEPQRWQIVTYLEALNSEKAKSPGK